MPSRLRSGLHLHFDPSSGIAGDMTVAALVDLGVPPRIVTDAIKAMGVKNLRTRFEPRTRGGFAGLGFVVDWPGRTVAPAKPGTPLRITGIVKRTRERPATLRPPAHEHRTYADIRRLLARAPLDAAARTLAEAIFARIAEAEARLHGVALDRVAFHELGAYDSIADIVGAAAALAELSPASVSSGPVVLGTGTVRTAHGPVPVPAPATAALLVGAPVIAEGAGELTTPTGAAILAAVVTAYGAPPPQRLVASGHGAGTRELADRANVLRVLIGEPLGHPASRDAAAMVLVQCNLDDMVSQLIEPLTGALFQAGAVDVWCTPIVMKKGRPAFEISALAPAAERAAVERAFFLNSTTLGVRVLPVERTVLGRAMTEVDTSAGKVAVKLASLDGAIIGAMPEFEDCRRQAAHSGRPVRAVHTEATAAAARLLTPRKRS